MVTDKEIFNLVDASPSLSDGSKIAYKKQLQSLKKALDDDISKIILHPLGVELLDTAFATKIAYTNAVNSLFKRDKEFSKEVGADTGLLDYVGEDVRKKWADLLKQLHAQRETLVDMNIRSQREKENWVSTKEWKEMDETLGMNERGSQAQLLVAFHTQIPPPRGGDLAQVRICDDEKECPEGNIIIVTGSNPRLIIRDHKTRRKYGAIVVKLPSSLEQDVIVSLKAQPRDYLFVNSHNEMYPTRDAFMTWKSNTFKRLFHRDVTTNIARREYATSEDMNAPLHKLKQSAKAMGHSVETHHAYRVAPTRDELSGGKRVTVSELVVGKEYLFKVRDLNVFFKATVMGKEEPNAVHPDRQVAQVRVIEVTDATPAEDDDMEDIDYFVALLQPNKTLPITDRFFAINDNIHAHEKFATEAIGRVHQGIPAPMIGRISEFLGHEGAVGDLVRQDVADKGREGDPHSVLRQRNMTGLQMQNQPATAAARAEVDAEVRGRVRPREDDEDDGQPPAQRRRRGGEVEGGGFFSDVKKFFGLAGTETGIQTAIDPRDLQKMCEQAYARFNGRAPLNVGKWDLIRQTDEDLLYRFGDTFVVAVRGTQGAPNGLDWTANQTIPFNGLINTQRCAIDLATVTGWKREFPMGIWYATGHSLGGAICDELLRAGLVTEAYTFNPAVQTKDFNGKLKNRRVYARGDPLYQLFGRFTVGAILQPAGSLSKELLTRVSPAYFAANALDQHNLSAFNSSDLSGGMALKAAYDDSLRKRMTQEADCVRQSFRSLTSYYSWLEPANVELANRPIFDIQRMKGDDYKILIQRCLDPERQKRIHRSNNMEATWMFFRDAQEHNFGGLIAIRNPLDRSSGHTMMFVKDPVSNRLTVYSPQQGDLNSPAPSFEENASRIVVFDMRTKKKEDGLGFFLKAFSYITPDGSRVNAEHSFSVLIGLPIDQSALNWRPPAGNDIAFEPGQA